MAWIVKVIELRKIKSKTKISQAILKNDKNLNVIVFFKKYDELKYSPKSKVQYYLLKNFYEKKENGFKDYNIKVIKIDKVSYKFQKQRKFDRAFTVYNNIKENNDISCFFCKEVLNINSYTIDHFIPKSRGGEDNYSNYKISCENCNLTKRAIHPKININLYNTFIKYVNKKSKKEYFSTELIKTVNNHDLFLFLKECSPAIPTYIIILNHLISKKYDKINQLNLDYIKSLKEEKFSPSLLKKFKIIHSYITS